MNQTDAGRVSERRVVAVLFADIAGFTAMAERMDPEAVTDAVNEIFRVLGAEVEAVGGHVDKFIGDSLMALFGAPIAHEDDARRAVRAALAMQRAMQAREEWATRLMGQPVRLRIGIHSGMVVWGIVGPDAARPTVMGDVVNLASRLQRAAPEGGILVSDAVYRLVRGAYLCKPWEPITVKGKAEPVAIHEILGERERAEPVARPPFVDREDDLQQLEDPRVRSQRGRAQVVMVLGEPGVGKTRLVEQFLTRLPKDMAVLQTSCPPYGGASLGPLADLFRQLADLRGPVTVHDVESHIPFGDRAPQAAVVLSRLFGLAEVPPGSDVPHETALLVAAEAIRRMVTRPMVVWIEDLQWADAGTRELLPFIVERMPDAPMLLIGTLRSDAEPLVWGKRTALTTIQLEPLADEHARAFLVALLGERLPEPAETALVDKSGGNPFYLNEIVATLRSAGTLVQDDRGHWLVTGRVEDVLPESIHSAVLARLDRLPPAYRAVLQRAAVAGATFRQTLLEAPSPEAGVAEALPVLEDAFLIRRRDPLAADPEYAFVHPLLREVAYASLLAKQRTALHRQVAEAMERLYPAQIDELAKTIGTHYLRAGCPDLALPYLIRAGEDAARRYAAREAIELLEEARRLAEETHAGAQCLPACELLGDLYLRVQDRGPKAWFEVWEFVRTHTDPQQDPIRRARAAIRAAFALALDNQPADAWRYLQEAEPLIPSDHPLWSDFHRVRAQTLVMESEYRAAAESAHQAVAIANDRGTLDDRSRAYAVLSHPAILPLLGDRGREMIRSWAEEAAASGDERLLIEARHSLVSDVWTRGIVDADLIATAESARHKAEEHGWTRDESVFSMVLGWAYFLAGRWSEAARWIRHAHELVTAHGERMLILLPLFRANLAMATGRLQEARSILEEALVHARFHAPIWLNHDLARCLWMLGDEAAARSAMAHSLEARDRLRCIACGCQANGIAAEFYAAAGDEPLAAMLADEAEATARDIGHVITQIRAQRARARLALRAGQPQEAGRYVAGALALTGSLPLEQPLIYGETLHVTGDAHAAAGALAEARRCWIQARDVFEGLGATWHMARMDEVLARAGAASSSE